MSHAHPWVPNDYQAVMPYLRIRDAAAALSFYQRAFGASERFRLMMPDGRVGHAEIDIFGCVVMLSDEFPEMGIVGPQSLQGTTCALAIYVPDVDKAVDQAVAEGAKLTMPARDEFYGDRTARLEDPFGHAWSLHHQFEKVSPEEMQRRVDELFSNPKSP